MSGLSKECLRALELDLLRSKRHDIDSDQKHWFDAHQSECDLCSSEVRILGLLADDGTAGPARPLDELTRHRAVEDILLKADDPAFDPYATDSFFSQGESPSNWKRIGVLVAVAAAVVALIATPLFGRFLSLDSAIDEGATLAVVKEPNLSGRFSLLAGEVLISKQLVDISDDLDEGEELVTGKGTAVVHLPTEIVASVGPQSRISLSGSPGGVYELWLHSGEVLLSVDPSRKGPPFSVRTPKGSVNVVGTVFSVSSDKDTSEVRVLRGKVEVQPNEGKRSRVETGMAMTIEAGRARALDEVEREALWKSVQILELIGDPDDAVVDVKSFPVGANVTIDGQILGVTPVVASIRSGHRHLSVSLENEEEVKELIDLGSGTRISRVFDLSEKQDAAVMDLDLDVSRKRVRPVRRARLSNDEMLYFAQSLRTQRKWQAAAIAYKELIDLHPGSSESAVALVSLGSIQLERLSNPRAAKRSFSRYLLKYPNGSLAREALLSKAKALRVMGQDIAELKVLERFQDRYPSSVHSEQVARRLEELKK